MLVVGVLQDSFPFSQLDAGDPARGFDIDVIDAIGTKLNLVPRYVAIDASRVLEDLEDGTYDMVAGGILYTLERATALDFTLPYDLAKQRLVVRADDDRAEQIAGFRDEQSLQVGAVEDTVAQNVGRDYFGENRMTAFDSITTALDALATGAIDGLIMDTLDFSEADATAPGAFRRLPGTLAGNLRAYVLKLGSSLTGPINQALYELQVEGVIRALRNDAGLRTDVAAVPASTE